MFCKYCGNEIEDGSKFCRFCGKTLDPIELSDEVKAPEVGGQNMPKEQTNDGHQVNLPSGSGFTVPKRKKGSSKILLVAGIAVLLIIIMAMAFSCGKSSKSDDYQVPDTDDYAAEDSTYDEEYDNEEDTEEEEPAEEEQESEERDESDISPEFKKMMDSYEAFFDEYVEFMKKYKNSSNTAAMMTDYAEYMTKYADYMKKLDEVDEDELTTAEVAYYTEVNARIMKKLAEIS